MFIFCLRWVMVGVCLGLPLTPWACRQSHEWPRVFHCFHVFSTFLEHTLEVFFNRLRTFGEFNVVVVCTLLDVIARDQSFCWCWKTSTVHLTFGTRKERSYIMAKTCTGVQNPAHVSLLRVYVTHACSNSSVPQRVASKLSTNIPGSKLQCKRSVFTLYG